MVSHRWGDEAGEISKNIGGGFKNVGLVYIDVTGVSRRAILKSVAKGMVVGKVPGGGELIVGGGDGGVVTVPQDSKREKDRGASSSSSAIQDPFDDTNPFKMRNAAAVALRVRPCNIVR